MSCLLAHGHASAPGDGEDMPDFSQYTTVMMNEYRLMLFSHNLTNQLRVLLEIIDRALLTISAGETRIVIDSFT